MRPIVATAALLLAAPAYAGGVGFMLDAGMHSDKVFYYSDTIQGVNIEDQDLWPQYKLPALVGHGGGGLEIVLGDRDDKILGLFRFYYLADLPQPDPLAVGIDKLDGEITSMDQVHANVRSEIRSIGMASVGLNWGIFGNPDTWQVGFTAQLGSGFLTTDHTEFLQANVGPMVTYKVARQVQLFADGTYQVRVYKGLGHGANLAIGARYLFD